MQAALPAGAPTSHPDEPRLLPSDKPVAPRCSPTCNENAGCFTKCASRCHNAFNVDGYTAYQRTERFPSFLRRSAFSLKAVNRRQRTGAVYPLLNGPGRFPFLPGPLLLSNEQGAEVRSPDGPAPFIGRSSTQPRNGSPHASLKRKSRPVHHQAAQPFQVFAEDLRPSCRICARTGCCSSPASFPRCRCRNRPADR